MMQTEKTGMKMQVQVYRLAMLPVGCVLVYLDPPLTQRTQPIHRRN